MSQAHAPIVLRTAAVWGTTVLALRNLRSGQSFPFGDRADAVLPKPDASSIMELPVRAVGSGWELDARGATGGLLMLRGRQEDPVQLAASGAPIPIVAGDYGLLQYGKLAVFFQFSNEPPRIRHLPRFDWGFLLALLFSAVAVLGVLALFWSITDPPAIPKPLELTSQAELAKQYHLDFSSLAPEPQSGSDDSDKGKGKKETGAKDKKPQGGGKRMAGREGRLGRGGKARDDEQTGAPKRGLGGMSDVLASDVGDEVRETLGTISSVADALGGLSSDRIVLGRGPGTGLRGSGKGGGGDSDGVPFGSGTMNTGWGAGKGAGYGSGSGGPGGQGSGGRGKGGKGKGDGSGTGERKVTGKDAPKKGQGLTGNQIARVVNSRYGAFRACYESAVQRNPSLAGNVSVSWTITPGGSVAGAAIGGSSLGSPRVEGCILRLFRRLHFPPADKGTGASWTFAFQPRKK